MIALTATSSFLAAATRTVRANFDALAGPAAWWIASRSSWSGGRRQGGCHSFGDAHVVGVVHQKRRAHHLVGPGQRAGALEEFRVLSHAGFETGPAQGPVGRQGGEREVGVADGVVRNAAAE